MPLTPQNVREVLQRAPAGAWSTRVCDQTNESRRWLLVVTFIAPTTSRPHNYGLLETGVWVAEYADHSRVGPPENMVAFLPILESDRAGIVSLVAHGAERCNLPGSIVLTFPLDQVLILALRSSDYWRRLAERWVDEGYPLNDRLAELLPTNRRVLEWQEERLGRVFRNE
jgi:hypothetical protein